MRSLKRQHRNDAIDVQAIGLMNRNILARLKSVGLKVAAGFVRV